MIDVHFSDSDSNVIKTQLPSIPKENACFYLRFNSDEERDLEMEGCDFYLYEISGIGIIYMFDKNNKFSHLEINVDIMD